MKAKKIVLNYNMEFNYTIIGFSTSLKSFRFIHFLNQSLNVGFRKFPDMSSYNLKGEELSTDFYYYYDDTKKNQWFTFSHKSHQDEYLIPKYKNLDFFLFIDDIVEKHYLDKLLKNLRTIKSLQFVNMIDPKTINGINLIYSDIELHVVDFFREKNESKHLW
ncbi:MAG: IPExxxVDY family protein [Bacteroidota bacterium]|nr:IPExxxVDY family protein [Bacteroidota bacterium]